MTKCLLIIFTVLTLLSCRNKKQQDDTEDNASALRVEIMNTDRAFSTMSEKKGLKNAYMDFIENDGVLLRPGTLPLAGGDAMDFITQSNDSSFVMTWEPKSASIAGSGDLGYTYGVYSIRQVATDSVFFGSYVTIWKRQPNGKWKFVLQSGNEGVE